MLALAIEYLTGRSVSARADDRDVPEWPPHPARLFFALVSAWAEAGKDGNEETALRWLEQQAAPAISASDCDERPATTVFVPPNDARITDITILPERRRRQARTFPSVTPHDPCVFLIWPEAEPSAEIRRSLERMAGRISYLGHSSSLVSVSLSDKPAQPGLVPLDQGGSQTLRVPAIGQLDALEHAHEVYVSSGIRGQLPCAFQAYDSPGAPLGETLRSVFGEMVVFRRVAGRHLPIEATTMVTSTLRAAVMAAAGPSAPELVSGHADGGGKSERPHLAFVALPDVGHRHADGHLLGVAAVLPVEAADSERRAALAALAAVERLTMGRAGEWKVERVTLEAPQRALQPATWTRPSTRWQTVTPIELDRFPDRPYGAEAESIVVECCRRVGLPEPLDVVLRPDPFVVGSVPWSAFARARQCAERRRRPLVHAALDFPTEVCGPVLLGAGRYLGLGLLRPVPR